MSQSVSATSWQNKSGLHIRVYSCDGKNVTEEILDPNGSWQPGDFKRAGTAVGATSWVDSKGTFHIRVYVSSGEGDKATINEYCYESATGWSSGGSWKQGS